MVRTYSRQPRKTVQLDQNSDSWEADPLQLTPRTALRLLQLPLHVVVEDAVNDAHFVRAVTRPEFIDTWREAERRHWLEFYHSGGITSAERLVDSWADDPLSTTRKYLICDSDAKRENNPSPDARKLIARCTLVRISHHVLRRRSIENYLPMQALNQWAHTGLAPQLPPSRVKISVWNALERLPRELRHYYNYKRGRGRDRLQRGTREANRDWRSVSLADRRTLRDGVHPEIASLFAPTALTMKPAWTSSEDVDEEMFGLVKDILANL